MSPIKRRILYAVLYEVIAILSVGPGLAYLLGDSMGETLPLAIVMSLIALSWAFAFNFMFELWEAKSVKKGRSFLRRLVHAVLFEGGLAFMFVPLMAWWLKTSLLEALMAQLAVLFFFLIYSFVFTYFFDRIFGLPAAHNVTNS